MYNYIYTQNYVCVTSTIAPISIAENMAALVAARHAKQTHQHDSRSQHTGYHHAGKHFLFPAYILLHIRTYSFLFEYMQNIVLTSFVWSVCVCHAVCLYSQANSHACIYAYT